MKFDRSQPGVYISGIAHAGLLAVALVSFADAKPTETPESVAVEMISPAEFSQMTRGEKTAPEPKPQPRPRASNGA
ncbi:MAG: protein TolA, partial [Alsobacter sp.]